MRVSVDKLLVTPSYFQQFSDLSLQTWQLRCDNEWDYQHNSYGFSRSLSNEPHASHSQWEIHSLYTFTFHIDLA